MSYTDISRKIDMRVTIYFPAPLVVTRDDYLVDVYWTEETGSPSHYPYGSVSANTASITLYSPKGLFDPNSTTSIYSNLIKRGLRLKLEIKSHSTDWLDLGDFYVQDWSYNSYSGTAYIEAADKMQDKLKGVDHIPKILLDVNLQDACRTLGILADNLTTIKVFSSDAPWSDTVNKLCEATRTFCIVDRQGNIVLKRPVLTTPYLINDNRLLVAIKNKSNLPTPSGNVVIEYGIPQIDRNVNVLQLSNESIMKGINTLGVFQVSTKPVLNYVTGVIRNVPNAKIIFKGTSTFVELITDSPTEGVADISITADVIKYVMKQLGSIEENSNIYSNCFVQNIIDAQHLLNMYKAFSELNAPVLEIETRGDPTILIGDTVLVESDKYNTRFEGIVIRHSYKYTGSLSCTTTVLHKEVVL